MPRETSLGMKVDEKPAITSLNKLIDAFEKLNTVKESVAPEGKIKLSVDAGDTKQSAMALNEIRKSLNLLNKSMSKFQESSQYLGDGLKSFTVTSNIGMKNFNINTTTAVNNITKMGSEIQNSNKDLLAFVLSMRLAGSVVRNTAREYINLTNSTFGVGVASQMTIREITKLNSKFMELGATSPISAVELSKAVDDLVRTGKTYEQSMTIISEVSKLAVASGDSLAHTSEVATKIIVSLGLKAENTSNALGSLHSVAIQTASSMGTLSEAYKQYAGTMGLYANASGRAGKELDDYKQKLLDLGLASSGVLANLGLSASSQGTKIKVFFSKLISLEQTAIRLFDQDMSRAGIPLTADKLAEMAKKDLPQAIELLSKLHKEGIVSTRTLMKMFTGRHFTEISTILRAVDGDVDRFTQSLTKGVSYMSDYNKQMYNLTNQWKQFNNIVLAGMRPVTDLVGDGASGLLMILTEFSKIDSPLLKAMVNLTAYSGTFITTSAILKKSLATLLPYLTGIGISATALAPIAVGVTALAGSLLYLAKAYRDVKVDGDSMLQTLDKNNVLIGKIVLEMNTLRSAIDSNVEGYKMLKHAVEDAYDTAGGNFIDALGLSSESITVFKNVTEMLKNPIRLEIETDLNKAKTDLLNAEVAYDALASKVETKKAQLLNIAKGTNYSDIIKTMLDSKYMSEHKLNNMDAVIAHMEKTTGKRLNIGERRSLNKIYKPLIDEIIGYNTELEKQSGKITEINSRVNSLNESISATSEYYRQMGASLKIDSMKQYVEYFNEFKETISGKKEWDAVSEIAGLAFKEEFEQGQIQNAINDIKESFKNIDIDFDDTEVMKKITQSIGYGLQKVKLDVQIDKIGVDDINATNLIDTRDRIIDIQKTNLKSIEQKSKANKIAKSTRNYEIKYSNILKETLSLEAERLKLGKTKEEQERIAYEYKLKQYKLDIDLSRREQSFLGQDLKKYGLEHLIGSTPEKIQAEIDKLYSSRQGNLKGDLGAEYRDKYKALVEYGKAVTETYNLEKKYNTEIASRQITLLNQYRNSMLELTTLKGSIGISFKSMLGLDDTSEIDSEIESVKMKIGYMTQDIYSSFRTDLSGIVDTQQAQELLAQEQYKLSMLKEGTNEYSEQLNKIDSIIDLTQLLSQLEDNNIKKKLKELEIIDKQVQSYEKLGSLLKKMETSIGLEGLGKIGDIFSGIGSYTSASSRSRVLNKEYGEIFKQGESITSSLKKYFDSEAFRSSMNSALEGADLGSAIGSLVGGITGGGRSSQSAGALGGLVSGLMGLSNPATLAISTGMSLLGGLFNKKGDEEKAQKFNAEQKKIFDANTDALNKLANNMSSLGGTVDSLNSMLLSTFSRLPTIGNLNRVTDSMRTMAKTLEATRTFENASYQITKRKKGKKGFMGIGATADTMWTETFGISVQELLEKYGFRGSIQEMTTQQLRDFSKWLDKFDMGESDNFSALAKAIESYAQSLDQMNINIDRFVYDATMEGFQGISSLQQEDLRKRIEEFYKNMGFQIDDEIRETINKLAEEMSVMVTVMQDVRGQFINIWKETGSSAGDAFLKSMTPYMEALLTNMSQLFYDVYFSDVTDMLNKEFKAISEKMVELKKQGANMKWDSVANEIGGAFDKVINSILSAKQNTESFNTVLIDLQKRALDAGLSLSEIFNLGLVSGTQQDVLEAFTSAMNSSEMNSGLTSIGDMVGSKVGDAITNKLMDSLFSSQILEFSSKLDSILTGNLNFSDLGNLMQDAMSIGMGIEEQRRKMEAIKDMFDFSQNVNYDANDESITYASGVSQSVVNNYYISSNIEAGNVIESDSLERLADALTDDLISKFRDRGYDF